MNLEGGVEIEECAGDTSTYLTTTRHSLARGMMHMHTQLNRTSATCLYGAMAMGLSLYISMCTLHNLDTITKPQQ